MSAIQKNRPPKWAQARDGVRRHESDRGTQTSVYVLLFLFLALAVGCKAKAPTGVTTVDLQGVWSGALENVTLLGRSLSGDVD